MAGETVITVVGNLTGDPETRTVGGATVANFVVAATPRMFKDGEWIDGATSFYRCSAWREIGEHAAGSLTRGSRVIVQGRWGQREYEKDGEKRQVWELEVDEVGPSLRYATAQVQRVQRNQNQANRREQYAQQQGRGRGSDGAPADARTDQVYGDPNRYAQQQPQQQAWSGGYDDETPF